MPKIEFDEIRHLGPENFHSLVELPSTKQKSEITVDKWDRKIERTMFYRGAKIIGMQTRTACGYRYYVRKDASAK